MAMRSSNSIKCLTLRGGAAWLALAAWPWLVMPATGESVTGADWTVHYNLPDQDYDEVPGEYNIRDAMVARINALQAGQTGTLATFTLSAAGTAGAILGAMNSALDRGARMYFIADYGLDLAANYEGYSLTGLMGRAANPLTLVQATNSSGIMHHKFGLFDYSRTNRVLLTGSWNFTSMASYGQWNIAIELRNNTAVYGAYAQEAAELLAGRFHYSTAKSHAPNGTRFRVDGAWGDCWVDFAPYPSSKFGGTNAQTDIYRLIEGAQDEIVFALNKLNRPYIRDALIAAANRGVRINGVIPKSDWASSSDTSYSVYYFLVDPGNYDTTNVVHMITPFSQADFAALDEGELDLVHEKWMVIDPWGEQPIVIHGSANWTDSALASTSANDENIMFLRHRDLARLFYLQFKRMTGLWQGRCDNWCTIRRDRGAMYCDFWIAETNRCLVEYGADLRSGTWTPWVNGIQGTIGRLTQPAPAGATRLYFRTRRY